MPPVVVAYTNSPDGIAATPKGVDLVLNGEFGTEERFPVFGSTSNPATLAVPEIAEYANCDCACKFGPAKHSVSTRLREYENIVLARDWTSSYLAGGVETALCRTVRNIRINQVD